jgi:hypothetical protein
MTGCAGHLPPCPAAGGPAWRELAIGHFDFGMPVDLSMAQMAVQKSDADWMAWLLLTEALREKGMPGQGDALGQAEAIAQEDRSVTLTIRPATPVPSPGAP